METSAALLTLMLAASSYASFTDLQKYYDDKYAETKVFLTTQKAGESLDGVAKRIFKSFIDSSTSVQESSTGHSPKKLDSMFKEWEYVGKVFGPFPSNTAVEKAINTLENFDHYASDLYEEGVRHRGDWKLAIPAFNKCFYTRFTDEVDLFFTGDADMFASVIALSKHDDGRIYVFVYLTS